MLSHTTLEKFAKWLKGWGFEPVLITPVLLLIVAIVFLLYDIMAVRAFLTALTALSPLWIPLFLARYTWIMWMHYVRYRFWFAQSFVLLEITLPPEVEKSPLAMEVVLATMWNSSGEGTFIARWWKGSYRPVWSLEIASNEGRVSFYIHMNRSNRNSVESRLYGQFPEAKITEVEDYAAKVPFNLEEYDLWGAEYDKAKAGAIPIKTYYDYALDKDTDEPTKIVDPISNVLEFFSTMGKDEYMWLQIIAKARKKDEWYGHYSKVDKFMEGGKKAIKDIMEAAAKRVGGGDPVAEKQALSRGAQILTEDERNNLEAIEKSMGKPIFECGIRSIYMAKRGRYNPAHISSVALLFNHVRSIDLNSINPARGMTVFDYPWQDFHNIRKTRVKNQLFFHYLHRAYFYVPYDQTPVFLNIEELASLWHFPSSAVRPPGLERVAAKRAEAPAGLPI